MSPVNDDVVFFTVLAAGLVPVLGPVDPSTGNLDPEGVDESTWSNLSAVLTTNLYGIPDRMDLLVQRCRRFGLLIVEDAAHALESYFEDRRIGEFSPVAAYSLAKHVNSNGGVLTFTDAGRRESLVGRATEELRRPSSLQLMTFRLRPFLRSLSEMAGAQKLIPKERSGYRMSYEPAQVLRGWKEGGGLDRFDRWVSVDDAAYRTVLPEWMIQDALRKLETLDENRRLRLEGTRKLLELRFPPRLSAYGPLFRVPLFVRERDRVLTYLLKRGLKLEYVYDPPLDIYAIPELAERLPSHPSALLWSRNVLPVDPLSADRFLELLKPRLTRGDPADGLTCNVGFQADGTGSRQKNSWR